MWQGVRLWAIWLFALTLGTYGTSLVYEGTIGRTLSDLIPGVPILLLGIWITGNVLASAKKAYRRQRVLLKKG